MPSIAALRLSPLERRDTPAVHFQFDYRYDSTGFFNDPARRAELERVGADVGQHLADHLTEIAPSGANTWSLLLDDPTTGEPRQLDNPTIPSDLILIFVGAKPSLGGSTVAQSRAERHSSTGDNAWQALVTARGQAGALTVPATDVGLWGGIITYNSETTWHFGDDPTTVGSALDADFYAVTTHELFHVLGFTDSNLAFGALATAAGFVGPRAEAVAGGPVPFASSSDHSHWANDSTSGGLPTLMDPNGGEPTRRYPTPVDWAAMADIGWEVDTPPAMNVTVSSSSATVAENDTVTLTATVQGSPLPTGLVVFRAHGHDIGAAPLAGGTAVLTTPVKVVSGLLETFAQGESAVTAVYSGDATYHALLSSPTTLTVLPHGSSGGPNPVPVAAGSLLTGGPANGSVVALSPGAAGVVAGSPFALFPGSAVVARTATADVTGDGVPDLIGAAGPGGGPELTVLDGKTGAVLVTFFAFEDTFAGGMFVAAADIDGDGKAEVVVTADESGGPVVAVYRGSQLAAGIGGQDAQLTRFFGIAGDPNFRGGCRPALGDLNGDGAADLVVSAGVQGGPRIAIFDGQSLKAGSGDPGRLVGDFFAFEDTLRNGAFVAAGDVTGDGRADIAFGGGPGGAPRVRLFDGKALLSGSAFSNVDAIAAAAQRANFFAGDAALRGGVRLTLHDVDGNGTADLVTGSGAGEPSHVRVYRAATLLAGSAAADQDLDPFGAVLANGVFVG